VKLVFAYAPRWLRRKMIDCAFDVAGQGEKGITLWPHDTTPGVVVASLDFSFPKEARRAQFRLGYWPHEAENLANHIIGRAVVGRAVIASPEFQAAAKEAGAVVTAGFQAPMPTPLVQVTVGNVVQFNPRRP
jgi:hypothetical protein